MHPLLVSFIAGMARYYIRQARENGDGSRSAIKAIVVIADILADLTSLKE